jgi:hypothetical protein
MIDKAMWLVTVGSIVGTVANIHKRRWCFYIWAATNATWALYDLWKGALAQSALMTVYFGLALWGIAAWKECKA